MPTTIAIRTFTAIPAMQFEMHAHRPSWLRFLTAWHERRDTSIDVDVVVDAWLADSPLVGQRSTTGLPAMFRFGPGAHKAVTLRPRVPMRLSCQEGRLWLTRDGDSTDYVLTYGESMLIPRGDVVVVLAMQSGLLLAERAERNAK